MNSPNQNRNVIPQFFTHFLLPFELIDMHIFQVQIKVHIGGTSILHIVLNERLSLLKNFM